MREEVDMSINKRDLTMLMSNLIIVKFIFTFPRNLFEESGNSAFITSVFMSLTAFMLVWLSFYAYRDCGNRSVLELSEIFGGRTLKIVVSLLVSFVLIANFTSELRNFLESVKIVLLPKTDIEILMILLAIAIIIGAKKGIFPISTINGILFPICLLFLGIICVSLINNYDINNLFPIFGKGVDKILLGTVKDISCFSDVLVLNILLPYSEDIEAAKSGSLKAVIIGGATLFFITLCYGLSYPYPRSEEFLLPIYQLSRMIKAGEYFQRFEAFFEFIWTITELIYAEIYLFVIAEVLAEGFSVKRKEMLLYPIASICILLTLEPTSVVDVLNFSKILGYFVSPVAFLLPIIVPLIYKTKERDIK